MNLYFQQNDPLEPFPNTSQGVGSPEFGDYQESQEMTPAIPDYAASTRRDHAVYGAGVDNLNHYSAGMGWITPELKGHTATGDWKAVINVRITGTPAEVSGFPIVRLLVWDPDDTAGTLIGQVESASEYTSTTTEQTITLATATGVAFTAGAKLYAEMFYRIRDSTDETPGLLYQPRLFYGSSGNLSRIEAPDDLQFLVKSNLPLLAAG